MNIPLMRCDYDWNLSRGLVCGSRLQTDLLTLDSRSGDRKFDNGLPGATGLRDRLAMGSGTRSLGDERMFSNTNNQKVLLGFLGAPVRVTRSLDSSPLQKAEAGDR